MESKGRIINIIEETIKEFVERMRPPENLRNQVDIHYTFENNELVLFEVRPLLNKSKKIISSPFARTKYITSSETWKLYWMRASGEWDIYEPQPTINDIREFFQIVQQDKHYCFFG